MREATVPESHVAGPWTPPPPKRVHGPRSSRSGNRCRRLRCRGGRGVRWRVPPLPAAEESPPGALPGSGFGGLRACPVAASAPRRPTVVRLTGEPPGPWVRPRRGVRLRVMARRRAGVDSRFRFLGPRAGHSEREGRAPAESDSASRGGRVPWRGPQGHFRGLGRAWRPPVSGLIRRSARRVLRARAMRAAPPPSASATEAQRRSALRPAPGPRQGTPRERRLGPVLLGRRARRGEKIQNRAKLLG